DNEEELTPMHADGRQGGLHRWRAHVRWDGSHALTLYCFVADTPQGPCWLAADGSHAHVPPEARHFRVHASEQPPAWVRDQVFYQIFPDRFARGLSGGRPTDRSGEWLYADRMRPVVQAEWGARIQRRHAQNTFFGGDLVGIAERLPYLHEELGASAIYLNPIFSAASNHRYDTSDYTQVDPHLGGNAALADLRAAMQRRGMRLVLDAVVNHTGADHPWFDRWGRHAVPGGPPGAAQAATSPWHGHYAWRTDGQPVGWKGHASLPVLDYACPAVQQAIYGAPDAVLRRWLRPPYAIDGWRLDVIHMLGEGSGARRNAHHVRAIRRAVREENPQAYVLGEHFSEATRWLQGDQEDGAMNYHGFAQPLKAWLVGLDLAGHRTPIATADFVDWLAGAMATIPYANQLAQLNLLDSHDTPRLLTELGGDLQRMKLAATLLFTWPGVPCIYYGDEIGLAGGADPDNRGCFDWDRSHWRMDLWTHYRRLAQARRTRAEWRHGATLALGAGSDWLAFARYTADSATVVAVNRGPAVDVTLPLARLPLPPLRWQDLDGAAVVADPAGLRLVLPARGSVVATCA
ncbi:MAG: maltodextrin glucosidase, partial [Burkholderiaceae bacterium]|nr:maltodextrin glucosidase [Burkholderiaceae bacterium]